MSALTPYDTGEMLEPKLYVTSTSGVTRDNAADFGKVDYDDSEGATICTIFAHPSTIEENTTLVQIDTVGGERFKIMLNDGELYLGNPDVDPVPGMSCAECGTTAATTYVVTTLVPGDSSTRTEVCRDCDTKLRGGVW